MDRVESLQYELSRGGQHAALITSMENVRYFTGHYVWTSHSPLTFAVIPAVGAPTLCVPRADESLARLASRIHVEPYDPGPQGYGSATNLCRNVLARTGLSAGRLGVESDAMTLDRLRALENGLTGWTFDDITPAVSKLRLIKDETEQLAFRHAAELMKFAMSKTTEALTPGTSELEIKGFMDQVLYAEAARRWPDAMVAAHTNVLSGERLSRLHDAARGRRVGGGEPVWVLSHTHWNGYWANISRNLFVSGGRPDADVLRAHEAVIEAQLAAVGQLLPGRPLGEAAKAADEVLARHSLLDKKMYGMFRGLGLRYDEPPRGTDVDTVLAPGMCICVQLHVRLPQLIVGQGDSVLITDQGPAIVSQ